VISANSTSDRPGRLLRDPYLSPTQQLMDNNHQSNAQFDTTQPELITRDQFMAFFRSDTFYEQVSDDDCREVFATVLKGSSDFTAEFLNDILADYSVGDIIALQLTVAD
jgi:hypothetical protein